jgi:hypothetical protein
MLTCMMKFQARKSLKCHHGFQKPLYCFVTFWHTWQLHKLRQFINLVQLTEQNASLLLSSRAQLMLLRGCLQGCKTKFKLCDILFRHKPRISLLNAFVLKFRPIGENRHVQNCLQTVKLRQMPPLKTKWKAFQRTKMSPCNHCSCSWNWITTTIRNTQKWLTSLNIMTKLSQKMVI